MRQEDRERRQENEAVLLLEPTGSSLGKLKSSLCAHKHMLLPCGKLFAGIKDTWKLNITSNGTVLYLWCSVAGLAWQIVDINLNKHSTMFIIQEQRIFGVEK